MCRYCKTFCCKIMLQVRNLLHNDMVPVNSTDNDKSEKSTDYGSSVVDCVVRHYVR
jgi:hypothetical protein